MHQNLADEVLLLLQCDKLYNYGIQGEYYGLKKIYYTPIVGDVPKRLVCIHISGININVVVG